MHTHVHMYVCIYIYIHIYVYTHVHVHVYIYIYMYMLERVECMYVDLTRMGSATPGRLEAMPAGALRIVITPSSHHNIFPRKTFSKGLVAQKPLFDR